MKLQPNIKCIGQLPFITTKKTITKEQLATAYELNYCGIETRSILLSEEPSSDLAKANIPRGKIAINASFLQKIQLLNNGYEIVEFNTNPSSCGAKIVSPNKKLIGFLYEYGYGDGEYGRKQSGITLDQLFADFLETKMPITDTKHVYC